MALHLTFGTAELGQHPKHRSMEDRQQEVTHLTKPMSPLPSVTASPALSPCPCPGHCCSKHFSEMGSTSGAPQCVQTMGSRAGAGLGCRYSHGARAPRAEPGGRQGLLLFNHRNAVGVFLFVYTQLGVCLCTYIYIHRHTYLPPHEYMHQNACISPACIFL